MKYSELSQNAWEDKHGGRTRPQMSQEGSSWQLYVLLEVRRSLIHKIACMKYQVGIHML
jgi:hypothetical protein